MHHWHMFAVNLLIADLQFVLFTAAPPGLAEEAAVASARIFQTEVETTSEIREDIAGIKPIEVVGYVGITKPKHPAKPYK